MHHGSITNGCLTWRPSSAERFRIRPWRDCKRWDTISSSVADRVTRTLSSSTRRGRPLTVQTTIVARTRKQRLGVCEARSQWLWNGRRAKLVGLFGAQGHHRRADSSTTSGKETGKLVLKQVICAEVALRERRLSVYSLDRLSGRRPKLWQDGNERAGDRKSTRLNSSTILFSR